ncbi:MAG TPA: hypothetical protein VJA66_00120 [Thermoanaerobaculia bacterium]
MSETGDLAGPPAAGTLSETGRRKLRVWRAIVRTSLTLTWICLALELALFFWPAAPRAARIAVGAVLVESFLTAVVVGAFGKCPACGQIFGMEAGRLTPVRCRGCGIGLAP